MAQHRKLTPAVITKIKSWVDQGLRAEEIARNIGCTVGTLRVRCSQLGISLRSINGRRVAISWQRPQALAVSPTSNSESIPNGHRSSEESRAFERSLIVPMSPATIFLLRRRAASRGLSETGLAASLLERIAEDDLYDAVLDE
jgi:hypothetical protein